MNSMWRKWCLPIFAVLAMSSLIGVAPSSATSDWPSSCSWYDQSPGANAALSGFSRILHDEFPRCTSPQINYRNAVAHYLTDLSGWGVDMASSVYYSYNWPPTPMYGCAYVGTSGWAASKTHQNANDYSSLICSGVTSAGFSMSADYYSGLSSSYNQSNGAGWATFHD